LLWITQLGTSGNDYSFGVATDGKGNVYISGMTDGSLGGANQGGADPWLAKYSVAGALRWVRQLGTSDIDEGAAGGRPRLDARRRAGDAAVHHEDRLDGDRVTPAGL
jgi:hypothetical protein